MTLEIEGLSHRYGSQPAITDVSFTLEEGELVALLGPSGCGKTTIVQAIAGHIDPTAGKVRLRGGDVTDAPPELRDVGVVFQRSTLFPHMTAGENVAYGLEAGMSGNRRNEIVSEYLELVGLAGRHDSRPTQLSGGQRRRVELARALAPEPDVLLLDEPLSALDRPLRSQLREEIARIQRETGVTTLFVTHNQQEALTLAERLVVLDGGAVSAVGSPRHLYESPPNRFVASFLGRSNIICPPVESREPLVVTVGETPVEFTDKSHSGIPEEPMLHVRPADITITHTDDPPLDVIVAGTVIGVSDIGRRYDISVRLVSGETVIVEQRRSPPTVDTEVAVGVDIEDLTIISPSA